MSDVATETALLEVRNLKVHFPVRGTLPWQPKQYIKAVDGVDLTIRRGETIGLVGESGCGKSTLARALLRLNRATEGSVTFDGHDLTSSRPRELRRIRRRLQMIFQDPYGSLNPRMTVGAILDEGLRTHNILPRPERPARIRELIDTVGLPAGSAARYPHEFSGGQRQRIGIARAISVDPDLIVADEATSALDVSVRAQIVNLLSELKENRALTMLFVAHDLSIVRHVSDRIVVMYLGAVAETAPSGLLYKHALHPYTIALLSAVPIPDPVEEQQRERIILSGDVPSPINPPSGCRFQPRCWLSSQLGNPEQCRTQRPELRDFGSGQEVACHFAEKLIHPTDRQARVSRACQQSQVAGGAAA